MKNDVRVKLVSRGTKEKDILGFNKQTPGNKSKLGVCHFIFNSLEKDYDWLVIIDDVPKYLPNRIEKLSCTPDHTILVTTEPSSISKYGKAFAKQFQYLITNQDEKSLPHPNALRSQTGNVWFYGKDYDEILEMKTISKTKKISTICSNKQDGHTIHKLRFDFTKLMEREIPELNRFGSGFQWIDTKAEGLDEYEFHVAIENHYADNVWTEKLADPFLGYCVPIYFGCPNIYKYFPEDSLILIDINDFNGSIKKIKEIISTPGEYERRFEAVKEARRRVIEEYNLLSMINKIIINHKDGTSTKNNTKIYCRRLMRAIYFPEFISFSIWKIQNFIKGEKSKFSNRGRKEK